MNVLQAVEKLNKLNSQVAALKIAIDQLEFRKEHNHEVRLLEEIKEEYVKQSEHLRNQLEITPLATTRKT